MEKNQPRSLDTLLVSSLGFVMAVFLAFACFVGQRSGTTGSALLPASTLEKLVAQGRRCQTLTDDQVFSHAPRLAC